MTDDMGKLVERAHAYVASAPDSPADQIICELTIALERANSRLPYDATQEEIADLKKALVQLGESSPESREELGVDYVRYAKRVIRRVSQKC